MAKRPRRVTGVVDTSALTPEEIAAVKARARDMLSKELKEKQEDALLAASLQELREAHDPDEKVENFTLDLAGHSDRIMLDGVVYFHGQTYAVPYGVKATLKEIVARGWDHEAEIKHVNAGRNRPLPRGVQLSPTNPNGVINTTGRMMGGL